MTGFGISAYIVAVGIGSSSLLATGAIGPQFASEADRGSLELTDASTIIAPRYIRSLDQKGHESAAVSSHPIEIGSLSAVKYQESTPADAATTGENRGPDVQTEAELYGPPWNEIEIEPPRGIPQILAEGVAAALDSYPSIRAARLAETAADREIESAKGQRYPSVEVEGRSYAGGSGNFANDIFSADIVVQQPIWAGGRIGASIDRARAASAVRSAETRETGRSIAIQVIDAYYQAVLAKRRMQELEEGNDDLLDLIASIERRVAQEVSPLSELTLVESRQAEIQRQFQSAQASFFSGRETFRQLTGIVSYDFSELPEYPGEVAHPASDDALSQQAACDPTVRRLEAEADLSRAEAELAEKQLYPQVNAQFSQSEITGSRVGIVVNSQLSNGLSQFRAIEAAQARALQAGVNIETAARETRLQLTNDLLLNYSTAQQIPVVRRAVDAAADVTASYRRQFVAGRRSWLEVVNAVREEITAELSLVDTETTAMASGARILINTCRWTPAIGS